MRGNPIEWISTRNPALDEGLDPCRINQPCARPLTPGLFSSPALGRGEPKSIEFLERQRVSSLYSANLNSGNFNFTPLVAHKVVAARQSTSEHPLLSEETCAARSRFVLKANVSIVTRSHVCPLDCSHGPTEEIPAMHGSARRPSRQCGEQAGRRCRRRGSFDIRNS